MREIPGELGDLPLLGDIFVLPRLVYYLGYRMCYVAAILACLDGRQAD